MQHLAVSSILLLVIGIAVPAQGIETLYPGHDTFIDQYAPNNVSGAKSVICVRNMYGSGARWELDGLFKFDIHFQGKPPALLGDSWSLTFPGIEAGSPLHPSSGMESNRCCFLQSVQSHCV